MTRPLRRRLLVLITLLSHLMAAVFVHVPMAYATTTPAPVEASPAPPCHELASDSGNTSHDDAPGCKSGPCKCPCAHAQALAFTPSLVTPLVSHAPSLGRDSLPLVPDRDSAFFRPPKA